MQHKQAAAALRTRPLPQPTASSLVVESFLLSFLPKGAAAQSIEGSKNMVGCMLMFRKLYGNMHSCPNPGRQPWVCEFVHTTCTCERLCTEVHCHAPSGGALPCTTSNEAQPGSGVLPHIDGAGTGHHSKAHGSKWAGATAADSTQTANYLLG